MLSGSDIVHIFPELLLCVSAMGLLLVGAFSDHRMTSVVHWLSIIFLILAAVISIMVVSSSGARFSFGGSIIVDGLTRFVKPLIFLVGALALVMSADFMERQRLYRFEFPVLMLFAACGMGLMVSAHDLITLYLGIELQSLTLYVIATLNRDSARSSEAGLKYFVLGALASGILLYGCSLIYGFSGTTNFADLSVLSRETFSGGVDVRGLPLILGLIFVVSGLGFKISAVPFHMWTPDVYEGAPTPITAFFAAAPKLAGMAILVRFLYSGFSDAAVVWQQIIIFLSVSSMILGSFGAIAQRNIKRLMAYSSIGHVGYALVGLASTGVSGVSALLSYMTIYIAMTLGCFACILSMRRDGARVEMIDDLAGTSGTHPFMALCLAILMFSLAGVPPLAGFFAKFFVFGAAVGAGLYELAILGVVSSVVGAFYYLRIVKIIYIDDIRETALDLMPRSLAVTMGFLSFFVLTFFIWPGPLITASERAAQSLFLVP